MQPLSSIECNYYANELWLLETEVTTPKKVYSFDLAAVNGCADIEDLEPNTGPVDLGTFPQLAQDTTLVTREHPDDGFYIYFERRRPWESGWDFEEPYYLLVFSDEDKDGVMDDVTTPTYAEFYENRPLDEWHWEYQ